MRGHRKRHDRALTVPIRALLQERGPAHPTAALAQLKKDGRVELRATMGDAYAAAVLLTDDGLLEHVTRAGATSGGYFRVPGDERQRWDR